MATGSLNWCVTEDEGKNLRLPGKGENMKSRITSLTLVLLSAVLWSVSLIILSTSPVSAADEIKPLPAEMEPYYYSIMRPDQATLQEWQEEYEAAPTAYIDPDIQNLLLNAKSSGDSFDLLNYIKYEPWDRIVTTVKRIWAGAITTLTRVV